MLSPKNSPTYINKEKLEKEKASEKKMEPKPQKKEEPEKRIRLDTFTCTVCGYQYDPEMGDPTAGIPPVTSFEDLPDDYTCPICSASKEYFRKD